MKLLALLPLIFSLSATAADWNLTRVVYHDYCPPGAVKARLCYFGETFDTAEHPDSVTIPDPYELGFLLINQADVTDDGIIRMGSEIQIEYNFSKWGKPRTRYYSYLLADNMEFIDVSALAQTMIDGEGVLTVRNDLSREFYLLLHLEGCSWYAMADFTEPSNYPPGATRLATMEFTNTDCEI